MQVAAAVVVLVMLLAALITLDIKDRPLPTEVQVLRGIPADRIAASAAVSAAMVRSGFRVVGTTSDSVAYRRRYRSTFTWIITIVYFPLGLLAFFWFVRVHHVRLSVTDTPRGQQWTLTGTLPISVARRAQSALEAAEATPTAVAV